MKYSEYSKLLSPGMLEIVDNLNFVLATKCKIDKDGGPLKRKLPIIITKNGKEKEFKTAAEAAKYLKVTQSSISAALQDYFDNVKGWTIRRKSEVNI